MNNKEPEVQGALIEFEDDERTIATFKDNGHFMHYKLEPLGWEDYCHYRGANRVQLQKEEQLLQPLEQQT